MVVHCFGDVLPTIIAESRVAAGTDDFIAAVLFQYAGLAFVASSYQSFCTSFFNYTSFGDAILFLMLLAGKRYVRLQPAKAARNLCIC